MVTSRVVEDLTIRISSNAREKKTSIVAYRSGGFKRAYKAVFNMCSFKDCHRPGPQIATALKKRANRSCRLYHQADIDAFVKKLIKSYR